MFFRLLFFNNRAALYGSGSPPVNTFYMRPDGTSRFLRPDGTSFYLRP